MWDFQDLAKACRGRPRTLQACLRHCKACLRHCKAYRGQPRTLSSMPRSCKASLHILDSHNYIYNFSYHRSSFELLIEFCLLIQINEIETAYFLNIPKRLYHIINLIFKIIRRKKNQTLCLKLNISPIEMKVNNLYKNIKIKLFF